MLDHLDDMEILARTIYGEARGEFDNPHVKERGAIAIANVVLNRLKRKSWFGNKIRDVCLKPWQFSCWNREDVNFKIISKPRIQNWIINKCRDISKKAFDGNLSDITKNADHYHSVLMHMRPTWARGKTPTIQIGNHVFYNLEE